MVTLFKGVQNQMVAWIVLISVGVIAAPAQVSPTAIFLDGPGEPQAFTYGISTLANAGGVLTDWGDALTGSATSVASTRGPQGDVYIAGIDPIGGLWINQLRSGTQTWVGWISAGMPFQAQSVDLAVAADGTVWLAAASPSGDIWLNSYTPSTGFSGWISVLQAKADGISSTRYGNPFVRIVPDGTIYVLAQTRISSLEFWGIGVTAGVYSSSSGFVELSAHIFPFGLRAVSLTVGSDGALYLCSANQSNVLGNVLVGVSMSRISGTMWTQEFFAPDQVVDLPRLAAGVGKIYAVGLDSQHNVVVNEYQLGTGNGWQTWEYVNGSLETLTAASVGDTLYVAGFDVSNDLWWYRAGTGWTYAGHRGAATSFLTASPR